VDCLVWWLTNLNQGELPELIGWGRRPDTIKVLSTLIFPVNSKSVDSCVGPWRIPAEVKMRSPIGLYFVLLSGLLGTEFVSAKQGFRPRSRTNGGNECQRDETLLVYKVILTGLWSRENFPLVSFLYSSSSLFNFGGFQLNIFQFGCALILWPWEWDFQWISTATPGISSLRVQGNELRLIDLFSLI